MNGDQKYHTPLPKDPTTTTTKTYALLLLILLLHFGVLFLLGINRTKLLWSVEKDNGMTPPLVVPELSSPFLSTSVARKWYDCLEMKLDAPTHSKSHQVVFYHLCDIGSPKSHHFPVSTSPTVEFHKVYT